MKFSIDELQELEMLVNRQMLQMIGRPSPNVKALNALRDLKEKIEIKIIARS